MTAWRKALTVGVNLWPQDAAWSQYREAVLTADQAGVDSAWTWDHLYAIEGESDRPIFEAWTLLAAWAALTERLELGLLVGANTFRNPGLTAKAALTVDHISGGRSWLGIGGAWFETEHSAYGLDFGRSPGQRLAWLDEALRSPRSCRATRHLAHGRPLRLPATWSPDRLVQSRGACQFVGGGEQKTLKVAARYADAWHGFGGVERFKRKIGILAEHCAAVGRDIGEITFSNGPYVCIRDEPTDALAALNAALAPYGYGTTDDETSWVGPPERIAERWRPFAEAGVTSPSPT
jgi:alkanesulfonate monooxygenase SsuD/methylene tetrahydromethanopterin reductase-like flavin-dependent oxidoreductase (luciferase family)